MSVEKFAPSPIILHTPSMQKTVTKDTKSLACTFGFRNEREFIARAVDEKVKRLKAVLFSRTAQKVQKGLQRAGLSEKDVLADFERSRR